MEADAIRLIQKSAVDAAGKTVEIDGVRYSTTKLHDVREKEPEAAPLVVRTLGAVAGYLKANRDSLDLQQLVLHVDGPRKVRLLGPLTGRFRQRETYVEARTHDLFSSSPAHSGFGFGEFVGTEEMVIALQTLFVPSQERDRVQAIVGNLADETELRQEDDGATQQVTVKGGIHAVDRKKVDNPFTLAPIRTFLEVNQPASPFVLRFRKTPHGIGAALFEADAGAWAREAVENIAEWLREHAPEGVEILA